MAEEFFLNGVPVEPSDGAEPPRDGGPGVAAGFEVARESTRCPRGGSGISAAGAAGTSLRTGAGQARTLPGRGQRTGSWRSSGTSRVWLRPGGWASRGPSKWKPTVRRPRRSRQVTLQAHPEVPNNHILPAEYLLIRLDWPSVPKWANNHWCGPCTGKRSAVRASGPRVAMHEMLEHDASAIKVVARRQACFENQHGCRALGKSDPIEGSPDVPMRAQRVDADVGIPGRPCWLIPGNQSWRGVSRSFWILRSA